ncbi:hypothetical protein BACCOPRO_02217 [Phocaeicola coprophilus DSM 18228 = JCM 13818]|uniref:Uncharacterized protein n=1 Tax=Phocaeicola coprophilus DSM 18228 = JCM 13818 TaxID=547042 RepID=S0FDU6_9BACT|nr:hypothetical protein BACCOPRO_02217 [Phocaeicola coprophilus DSM 18228 = JCM 13818]
MCGNCGSGNRKNNKITCAMRLFQIVLEQPLLFYSEDKNLANE